MEGRLRILPTKEPRVGLWFLSIPLRSLALPLCRAISSPHYPGLARAWITTRIANGKFTFNPGLDLQVHILARPTQ